MVRTPIASVHNESYQGEAYLPLPHDDFSLQQYARAGLTATVHKNIFVGVIMGYYSTVLIVTKATSFPDEFSRMFPGILELHATRSNEACVLLGLKIVLTLFLCSMGYATSGLLV